MTKPTETKRPAPKTYTHEEWQALHERMDQGDVRAWREWERALDAHEIARN